jgi:hypothetical protein
MTRGSSIFIYRQSKTRITPEFCDYVDPNNSVKTLMAGVVAAGCMNQGGKHRHTP